MPVSKKRKKDGKPVHMKEAVAPHPEEHHAPGTEPKPGGPPARVGKPSNPFVAQQSRKASQRGR